MQTLELFRKLKCDIDLFFSGDYTGSDDECAEAKRALMLRGMLAGHIDRTAADCLRATEDPVRTVAHSVINGAALHYGILSRFDVVKTAGAIKGNPPTRDVKIVAAAEAVLAAIDSGADFWAPLREFAWAAYRDASWFDNLGSMRVMRLVETEVALR